MYRGRKSHTATMAAISGLHQPLHQLPLLKHCSVIQTEGLHPVSQRAASIAVQHVCPILFIHRHHLTLHALRPRHCLPKTPASPVGVTVKAEGMGGGLAELSEALFALDVVSIGRNQQATGLELDAVARAQSESGPFCRDRGGGDIFRCSDTVMCDALELNK